MTMKNKPRSPRGLVDRLLFMIQMIAGIAAVIALGVLLWSWYDRQQSDQTFIDLQKKYTVQMNSTSSSAEKEANLQETVSGEGQEVTSIPSEEETPLLQVNFTELQHDWPDAVAWIQWPLMNLNFPIMHGSTNSQYLRALPDGSWNEGGSIFLEANNQSIYDLHAIVYGHNMENGSMFGQLKNFLEEDYFASHREEAFFILYTPEGVWRYDLFSVAQVQNTDPDAYLICHTSGEEYTALVTKLQESSLYQTGITVDGTQPVLTLSTCDAVGAAQGNRLVLHAVRGEQLG